MQRFQCEMQQFQLIKKDHPINTIWGDFFKDQNDK